ncbi:MAG: L,D-transpeptidase, partial [Trebonia sp.]
MKAPAGPRAWTVVTVLAAATAVLGACSTGGSGAAQPAVTVTHTAPKTSAAPSTSSKPKPPSIPVHIKLLSSDGQTYGVGMPVIAYFSQKISSAAALQKVTKVTVNGTTLNGAWYFETSAAIKGYPIEGHWRPQHYWPAHAAVHVDIPAKGVTAGMSGAKQFVLDDSLTLNFSTGPANIVTVNDSTHQLTVVSDGKPWATFPVSLGSLKAHTPTARGTKVVMEKLASVCMSGNPPNAPPYHECGVKYDQRLTYGGEYLHAAPWNTYNIDHGINSSNGCTNLYDSVAKKLYG